MFRELESRGAACIWRPPVRNNHSRPLSGTLIDVSQLCEESALFYLSVEEYKVLADGSEEQLQKATAIFDTYLKQGADFEIQLPPVIREQVRVDGSSYNLVALRRHRGTHVHVCGLGACVWWCTWLLA